MFLLTVVICLSLLSVFYYPQKWRTAFGLPVQPANITQVTGDAALPPGVTSPDSLVQVASDTTLKIADNPVNNPVVTILPQLCHL